MTIGSRQPGGRRRSVRAAACAVGLAAVLVLSACERGGHESSASGGKGAAVPGAAGAEPRRGGRLVVGVQQEPERLSELLNSTATTHMICQLIFARFVKYDSDLRLQPDLIVSLPSRQNGGISTDFLTYTYHLRSDARWEDGHPLTSADVAFTWRLIMDPKINVESREGWDVIESVDTPDSHTVVFRLKEPYPDFVAETFYDEPVLPRHVLEDKRGAAFHRAAFHGHPVGSGPFKVGRWRRGESLELLRNGMYYGEGPFLDEIMFKFIPDEHALLVQLETGEIDLYDNVSASFVRRLKTLAGISIYATPTLMYEHLDLNTENPILSDKRVRRAIAFAVNRRTIVDRVYHGWAEAAVLDEHPSSRYFSGDAARRAGYDPARSRALLSAAGWIDSDGDGVRERDDRTLSLTISATAGNPAREKTELVLQQQFREVGIDLRIKNYNATILYGSYDGGGILKNGRFDIAMYAWLSSPEPATKESLYSASAIPPHGQNHPRFRHKELSRLLKRGAVETDEAERIRLYQKVADILVDEAPVVPLFWYTAVDAVSDALKNYKPNPTMSTDTWNAAAWYLVPADTRARHRGSSR